MIAGTLRRARRKRLNRALTLGVTVVLAAGLAVVWVRVVQTLTAPPNAPRAVGEPGALVWDGRVFATPRSSRHTSRPEGCRTRVGSRATRLRSARPRRTGLDDEAPHDTTTKTAKPKPATHHRVAAPAVTDTRSRPLTSLVLTILLLLGGLVLGGSAVLPPRYAPVAVQRLYADPDRRMVALAAATAILLGFGVSFYLT